MHQITALSAQLLWPRLSVCYNIAISTAAVLLRCRRGWVLFAFASFCLLWLLIIVFTLFSCCFLAYSALVSKNSESRQPVMHTKTNTLLTFSYDLLKDNTNNALFIPFSQTFVLHITTTRSVVLSCRCPFANIFTVSCRHLNDWMHLRSLFAAIWLIWHLTFAWLHWRTCWKLSCRRVEVGRQSLWNVTRLNSFLLWQGNVSV